METKLWFKRKIYGWGFTPSSWQGWLSTAIYLIVILWFATRVEDGTSLREQFWPFIFPAFIVTWLFVLLASWKGEKPRWQWGESEERKNLSK